MTISENQQRSINAIATVVEQKLQELEKILFKNNEIDRGIKIIHERDLRLEQEVEIQKQIDIIYQVLRDYCNTFNVPKETRSVQKEIYVRTSFLWEELAGSTSKYVNGYKEMELETIKKYDQYIELMLEATKKILANSVKQ